MLSMSLKTLSIILMCFDGKKPIFLKKKERKKTIKSTATVTTKECRKY